MEWLYIARIVSTFAVIVLHISAYTVTQAELGTFSWWAGNLYDSSVRWCVPVFIMISGALLLSTEKIDSLSVFYKKRIGKILVPLLFWSFFFISWSVFKTKINGEGEGDILKSIMNGRPYYHMWFLYMIIGLYMFTPLIRILVSNASEERLLFFVFLMFVFCSLSDMYNFFIGNSDFLFVGEFIYYVPYYICGHLIAKTHTTKPLSFYIFLFLISLSLTCACYYLLSSFSGKETGLYFYSYLSFNVIVMSVSFMRVLKFIHLNKSHNNKLKFLSDVSLGIYLIHPVFIEAFYYLAARRWIDYSIFSIPLMSMIVFACCVVSVFFIKKIPYLRRIV
ncbi:acyltransferase [Dickeya fangzhongdai]|uniref:acyltransferase n=1 Tax=Dickeya fangzhongdai TaxID=1778540 RepID=UPI0004F60FA7|nr:acyltransferase family protein [Dickeya fangzhongdai]AIR67934.1 acyltransferase [Dickeya fangzhongdai]KGT98033.1 acyltransferase [Dickeya fangzhongdai]KHN53776.1 acyltransferase [Dickeya fangzhongdai]